MASTFGAAGAEGLRTFARRRRAVLRAAVVGVTGLLLVGTGCTDTRPLDEDAPTSDDTPTAEEALAAVGIPAPEAELSLSEGITVSDLDEWSVRVSFTAPVEEVTSWVAGSFNGSEGLPVSQDGGAISQRFTPEEVRKGARYITGSNPSDPSATYTVLISPEGTDVVVAAARTSR